MVTNKKQWITEDQELYLALAADRKVIRLIITRKAQTGFLAATATGLFAAEDISRDTAPVRS